MFKLKSLWFQLQTATVPYQSHLVTKLFPNVNKEDVIRQCIVIWHVLFTLILMVQLITQIIEST